MAIKYSINEKKERKKREDERKTKNGTECS